MLVFEFTLLLVIVAYAAGLLGSLTGLGGGLIITPVLVLWFGVNIYYAMGASLISVIATSSTSAAAYLKEGYTNLRIGMLLEVVAAIGAVIGAILTKWVPVGLIAIIFGVILIFSAYLSLRRNEHLDEPKTSHPWAVSLQLEGTYPVTGGKKAYTVQKVPQAMSLMGVAGILSGLLGIGSGALKVLAMDQAMKLPYKVATTTSNFIIGITAAVSAGVYFKHGFIDAGLTAPVVVGVVLGSYTGAKVLPKMNVKLLRAIFSVVVLIMAIEMLYKGISGGL